MDGWNRHFSKEKYTSDKLARETMLNIWEMKIRASTRYHSTCIVMTIITEENPAITSVGRDVETL